MFKFVSLSRRLITRDPSIILTFHNHLAPSHCLLCFTSAVWNCCKFCVFVIYHGRIICIHICKTIKTRTILIGWDKNVSTKTVLVHVFVSSNLRVCMSVFAVVVYLYLLVYFFLYIWVFFVKVRHNFVLFWFQSRTGGWLWDALQIPLFLQIVFHVTGGFISLATDIYPQLISEVNLFLIDFFC